MQWGKFLSPKWIQIWVCFSGQCYGYYARVYNSLKQGISISSSYSIYSIQLLTLVCVVVTVIVLMNWKVICNTFSRQIAKYSQTLNYLLEINFFPSVFITKLFLHLLEPLYKTCLQFKSTSKYSLVQYFWSLASKVFFPLLWLHAFYCITASCLTLQQFNLWQWEIQFPFTQQPLFSF